MDDIRKTITVTHSKNFYLEIECGTLMEALKNCSRAILRWNNIPVLEKVRFKTGDNKLTISATNQDLWIEHSVESTTDGEADFLIYPKPLIAMLSDCHAQDTVKFSFKNSTATDKLTATISNNNFTLTVNFDTDTIEDFPNFPNYKNQAWLGDNSGALLKHIQKISYAISTEETRYYLNGIYIHPENDQLVSVATDGHRMAVYKSDLDGSFNIDSFDALHEKSGCIIPRLALTIITDCLPKSGSNSHAKYGFIEKNDTHLFHLSINDDIRISSKLVDGTFPDYKKVFPKSEDGAPISLNRKTFSKAITAFGKLGHHLRS